MSKVRLFTRLPALAASSLLVAVLPALPAFGAAQSFQGKVADVSDGDTLVIGSGGRVRVVQLAGIDAPELSQDFGKEARDYVKQMTRGKKVTVEVIESKSPQSLVARVTVDGKDLAAALVESGFAWSEQDSSADLKSAQEKAKSGKQGLWASANPTPPWDFRKNA
jgi:endonuclease YncB( thermonuclease family)